MNIFIDFDNTIVDSTKAFVSVYNDLYNKNVNADEIINYDFSPQINLQVKDICKIFSSKSFYDRLELFDFVIESLQKFKSLGHQLILVTNCSADSCKRKIDYLKKFGLDKLFDSKIYLDIGKAYCKDLIDMSNAILIDDHIENHKSSNAKFKFCFKKNSKQTWSPNLENEQKIQIYTSWKELQNNVNFMTF